jgi:hypothetical protein
MSRADATAESYPRLRELLGEDGFKELATLIRTTYEANVQRRRPTLGDVADFTTASGREGPR